MTALTDFSAVAANAGFRRLFAVRLASQGADGAFQVGLATLFFFNPEQLATPGSVALAFAVLLLPFTVVGPFVGPLLDRWSRQRILVLGNGVRLVLAVILAAHMALFGVGPAVYLLALVALSINRFLLAALSASLPRVVPREHLTMANSLTPTLGAAGAVMGAVAGFTAGWFAPAGPARDGSTLLLAAGLFAVAALLAWRIGREELGPDAGDAPTERLTLADMLDGVRHLRARRTPSAALAVMAAHRFLYGVNFLALLLISRNLLAEPRDVDSGIAIFGILMAVSFTGNGLAIVLTPLAHRRLTPASWVVVCLGISTLSQILLAVSPELPVIAIGAVLMGLGVQGAKIAVDTIVHRDTADAYRGRAFALYDVLYNVAFVGAAALAALALPDTGWSRTVFLGLTAVYFVTAFLYRRRTLQLAAPA